MSSNVLRGYALRTLEYVHVIVSLSHSRRGDVNLILVCPSGTSSVIGAARRLDDEYVEWSNLTFSFETFRFVARSSSGNARYV